MREETRNWIAKANKDLSTAGFALRSVDGPLPLTTALHCQISAEKYLKAFLAEHDISFSHTQNLTLLFEACVQIDNSFESLRSDIKQLNGYSTASRYPTPDDSLEFREEAITSSKRIRDFVLDKLT